MLCEGGRFKVDLIEKLSIKSPIKSALKQEKENRRVYWPSMDCEFISQNWGWDLGYDATKFLSYFSYNYLTFSTWSMLIFYVIMFYLKMAYIAFLKV